MTGIILPPPALTEDEVRIVQPTLGGRAGAMVNSRSQQLFGNISTVAVTPEVTFVPSDTIVPGSGIPEQAKGSRCERLWRIRSAAVGTIRSEAAPVGPLTRDAILQSSPAGLGKCAGFHALVGVSASSGITTFRMDLGQTIDIVAFGVNINYLGPAGSVEVGSSGTDVTAVGLVTDCIVGWSINMIEESDCHCAVEYTQHFLLPQAVASTIEIPRFARDVKIQFGPLGAVGAGAPWGLVQGGVGFGLTIGQIEFTASGLTSTDDSSNVADATHILTDIDGTTPRFATLTWVIRP